MITDPDPLVDQVAEIIDTIVVDTYDEALSRKALLEIIEHAMGALETLDQSEQ